MSPSTPRDGQIDIVSQQPTTTALPQLITSDDTNADRSSNGIVASGQTPSLGPSSDRHQVVATSLHNDTLQPAPATIGPSERFSLMRFRHFSDTQLFTKAKIQQAAAASDSPSATPPPAIVTTAPSTDLNAVNAGKRSKRDNAFPSKGDPSKLVAQSQSSLVYTGMGSEYSDSNSLSRPASSSLLPWRRSTDQRPPASALTSRLSMALNTQAHSSSDLTSSFQGGPAAQEASSRPSSERVVNRRSFFFRPNKRKSLFPLPPKTQVVTPPQTAPVTPRASISAVSANEHFSAPISNLDGTHSSSVEGHERVSDPNNPDSRARSAVSFATPAFPLLRNTSSHSAPSSRSPPSTSTLRTANRDRASTMSTFHRASADDMTPPPTLSGSARNSISTSGRASLGGLLTLNRFRHGSDTNGSRHASPGPHSKSNSFAFSRDLHTPPSRLDNESVAMYLDRLRNIVPRGTVAATLSQSGDPFLQTVLRSYTRKLPFFGEPIDMSLRKFLLEAELPKETVHVDRVIQAFADRYHECNPGIFMSSDEAYVIAFSLMILHTDAFNKNNKHKMTKEDYIKNARGQHVEEDILACFYENICYTPFIHFDEDDYDAGADKLFAMQSRKLKLKNAHGKKSSGKDGSGTRKLTGPVDPYSLIIESKLDQLRPSIKASINLEDPYTYLGTLKSLNSSKIQSSVTDTGVLEIISARSRPAAFETKATRENPDDSRPGVVQIQVTKVGLLWRKMAKKKKARSPWQEWGAILTGSQLYFFRNVGWVKSLMNQYSAHQKAGHKNAVIFKPSLEDFKPDALTKTDDAVALLDRSYNKHKNAFQLLRTGGEEEVFLADSENDLNEWISLINYTAAFRYAGVAVRGFLNKRPAASLEQRVARINSTATTATVQSLRSQSGQMSSQPSIDPQAMLQVMAARRRIMILRIAEAEIALADMNKKLDEMLRNARHLQILAPIQPRTREVVIHAAARMDAMLKWSRREIWRTRCYKDILSMDALEDSEEVTNESAKIVPIMTTNEGENPPDNPPPQQNHPISTTPQTPKFVFEPLTLPPAEPPFVSEDVFKTPPETNRGLNYTQNRGSWGSLTAGNVASPTAARPESLISASASSSSRRPSMALLSSTSSLQNLDGLAPSPAINGAGSGLPAPRTPLSNVKSTEPSNNNTTSQTQSAASSAARPASEAAGVTPESVGGKTRHRMSLHRSFRDTPPESHSSRHRRARDSASTVRSESGNIERAEESTMGLERSRGSFMVHGKQASVITFGGGWADDKMRIRRENDRVNRTTSGQHEDAGNDSRRASDGTDVVPESTGKRTSSLAADRLREQIELAETYAQGTHEASITAIEKATPGSDMAGHEYFDAPEESSILDQEDIDHETMTPMQSGQAESLAT